MITTRYQSGIKLIRRSSKHGDPKIHKTKYLLQFNAIKQKKCAKTKSSRNMINYTFLKIFSKFLETKCLFKETENVQILFTGICAKELWKICNCAIFFLLFKAFQKAIKSKNQWPEVGLNLDLDLRQFEMENFLWQHYSWKKYYINVTKTHFYPKLTKTTILNKNMQKRQKNLN